VCSSDLTIATRILTSNHPKLFSTHLVEQNRAVRNISLSPRQNAENEYQLKHKEKLRN
jgi:hypothetical protein